MLIEFECGNFRSFRVPVSFDMIPGKSQMRAGKLAFLDDSAQRVLPVAAIFGGNASGKSNLIQALAFLRFLVVQGPAVDGPIPDERFKLDPVMRTVPMSFAITFAAESRTFRYRCAVTPEGVESEQLDLVVKTTEQLLFARKGTQFTWGKWRPLGVENQARFETRLDVIGENTRPNQLFLNSAAAMNVAELGPVWRWFRDQLVIITPDMAMHDPELFSANDGSSSPEVTALLRDLDTGIEQLVERELPDEALGLPEPVRQGLLATLPDGAVVKLPDGRGRFRWVSNRGGRLRSTELIPVHRDSVGNEVPFEIEMESDGTRRLLDMLPTFLSLARRSTTKTFVIDELDRSWHTTLVRALLERFLEVQSPESRSQLIFSTHDVMLFDPELLRKDELWVLSRHRDGSSELDAVSSIEGVRKDLDLRKSYLRGRFGGVPRVDAMH